MYSAFSLVQIISFIILWRVVQILSHPPGGTLTLGNNFHADLKKTCEQKFLCERNCSGQWVVRRIGVLITRICTRTLQGTQVLLGALCNFKCQPVMLLALWQERRHWVYLIVSFFRFLPSIMTRWNFEPLDLPVGSALNAKQFQMAQVPQK